MSAWPSSKSVKNQWREQILFPTKHQHSKTNGCCTMNGPKRRNQSVGGSPQPWLCTLCSTAKFFEQNHRRRNSMINYRFLNNLQPSSTPTQLHTMCLRCPWMAINTLNSWGWMHANWMWIFLSVMAFFFCEIKTSFKFLSKNYIKLRTWFKMIRPVCGGSVS